METIRTHIHGLDELLGGGIPKNNVVLVSGPPGTRKTSLAYSILHNNAKRGIPCLFVHLEESMDQLRANMTELGMEPLDQRQLYILDIGHLRRGFGPMEKKQDWSRILNNILDEAFQSNGYRLMALDSLPLLYSLARSEDPRLDLFHLVSYLKDNEVTSLFINEVPFAFPGLAQHSEDFLVDGILYLRNVAINETDFQLRLRCVKMRGLRNQDSYHALSFGPTGFILTDIVTREESHYRSVERPIV
jgi:KaiC/GvpD/RAD55 family RecA-like ATPase